MVRKIVIRVQESPPPALVLVCFVMWLTILYWKLILAAVLTVLVIGAIIYGTGWIVRRCQDRASRKAADALALARRADQQHAWVCAGDPRGTYGHGWRDEGQQR